MAPSVVGVKLTYLPVRALAEPIRMLAKYGGYNIVVDIVGLEFISMTLEEKLKLTNTEQLPSLKVEYDDGETILLSQSGACMRFLASLINDELYPSDPLKRAKVDEAYDTANEFSPVNPIVNMVAAGEIRDARETDFFGKAFDRRLRYCARKLEGRSFLCGNKPTIADFQMFHYMDHCLLIRPSCLDEYPNITEWVKGMKSLPGVAEYLNERPQVGTDKLGRPDTYIRGSKS